MNFILKNKKGFEMEFLIKIALWIAFFILLLLALFSIFRTFKIWK